MGKQGFLEHRNRGFRSRSFFSGSMGWNGVKFGGFEKKRCVKNRVNRTYLFMFVRFAILSHGMEHFRGRWSSVKVGGVV